jgi:hypothetical protein
LFYATWKGVLALASFFFVLFASVARDLIRIGCYDSSPPLERTVASGIALFLACFLLVCVFVFTNVFVFDQDTPSCFRVATSFCLCYWLLILTLIRRKPAHRLILVQLIYDFRLFLFPSRVTVDRSVYKLLSMQE